MRKRVVFEFAAMVFLMPFLLVSCAKEDMLASETAAFGYSVGFPFPVFSFLLEPFRNFRVFPTGIIDLILLGLTLYGLTLFYRRGFKILYSVLRGLQVSCGYIAAHFIYNLYYPVYYLYGSANWDKDGVLGGQICYMLLFPYLFICEKMGVALDLSNTLFVSQRLNLALGCFLYFALGISIAAILNFRRSHH